LPWSASGLPAAARRLSPSPADSAGIRHDPAASLGLAPEVGLLWSKRPALAFQFDLVLPGFFHLGLALLGHRQFSLIVGASSGAEEDVPGFTDLYRQITGAAGFRIEPLLEPMVGLPDLVGARAGPEP